MPDYTHLFVAMRPDTALSDLVRHVKANSSPFINNKGWVRGKFSWQEAYGAFSYAQSQVRAVINYILNQEQHHAERRFREEYIKLLKKFEITFERKYLFEENNPAPSMAENPREKSSPQPVRTQRAPSRSSLQQENHDLTTSTSSSSPESSPSHP
jgi:hypothetical protein